MKKFVWLLLSFLLFYCEHNSHGERIYDEYLQLNRQYWSRVNNLGFHSQYNYFEGDTLTLSPKLSFLMIPNDTVTEILIEPKNFYDVLQPTEIIITKSFEHSVFWGKGFEIRTLDLDSNLVGHISSDDLITNIEGLESLLNDKDQLLARVFKLEKEYKEQIKELAIGNNITVDSLYNLMAKEHSKATGERFLSY